VELAIKALRKKLHISQTEFANAVGVSLRTVGSWERGESVPNAEQVWNCAVALGCTPNDILGWYEDHPREDSGDKFEALVSFARSRSGVFSFAYPIDEVGDADKYQLTDEWRAYLRKRRKYLQ
jgi:transcriptional regulator with XRE-family HTH domain